MNKKAAEILREVFDDSPYNADFYISKKYILKAMELYAQQQVKNLSLGVVTKRLPHVCPVCNGNGLVPNGFYRQTSGNWVSTDATPDKCQSCNGTGIVYSE